MVKKELAKRMMESTGYNLIDCEVMIEAFTTEVKKAVSKNDSVYIRGFGVFSSKTRKAKIGQNITKGVAIEIPERQVAHFKPYFTIK